PELRLADHVPFPGVNTMQPQNVPVIGRDCVEVDFGPHTYLGCDHTARRATIAIGPPCQAVPFEQRLLQAREFAYRAVLRRCGVDDMAYDPVEALAGQEGDLLKLPLGATTAQPVDLLLQAPEKRSSAAIAEHRIDC